MFQMLFGIEIRIDNWYILHLHVVFYYVINEVRVNHVVYPIIGKLTEVTC